MEPRKRGKYWPLSRRQWEVLKLLAEEGLTRAEIAVRLGIGERTVNNYLTTEPIKGIYERIGVTNQAQAIHWFHEHYGKTFGKPAIFETPPRAIYPVLGQDELTADIKQRILSNEPHRTVALYGKPGVGKTTLVLNLVYDSQVWAEFPDGILWSELGAESATKESVLRQLEEWATVLGISKQTIKDDRDPEVWSKAIKDVVINRRMLFVIDDAWYPKRGLPKYDTVARYFKVGGEDSAHILTTRLRGAAETFAGSNALEVVELSTSASIELLRRVARELVDTDLTTAQELANRVGNLPLSLILIGNQLLRMTNVDPEERAKQLLQDLNQVQLSLLASSETTDGPSVSLEAVIAISDDALDEAAQRVLRALAIFPPKTNTFSEEAALVVTSSSPATLRQLHDYSLIEVAGSHRYTVHKSIVLYARSTKQHLYNKEVDRRLVEYFTRYATQHQDDITVLAAEEHNFYRALKIANENNFKDEYVAGVFSLYHLMSYGGLLHSLKDYLLRALTFSKSLGHTDDIITTLRYLGGAEGNLGNFSQAKKYGLESLQLAETYSKLEAVCDAKYLLGGIAIAEGELEEARQYLNEGLKLATEQRYEAGMILLLRNMTSLETRESNWPQAEFYIEQSLELARKNNASAEIATDLVDLGAVKINLGHHHNEEQYFLEAKELLEEALSGKHPDASKEALARGYRNLAEVFAKLYGGKGARALFQKAARIAVESNQSLVQCDVLKGWGEFELQQGKIKAAFEHFDRLYQHSLRNKSSDYEANALFGLARIDKEQGDLTEACRKAQESWEKLKEVHPSRASIVKDWREANCG
jgi:DNA-binding CsgD family transcriptional regulator/tetratricopeptide (TPR) repeat protein